MRKRIQGAFFVGGNKNLLAFLYKDLIGDKATRRFGELIIKDSKVVSFRTNCEIEEREPHDIDLTKLPTHIEEKLHPLGNPQKIDIKLVVYPTIYTHKGEPLLLVKPYPNVLQTQGWLVLPCQILEVPHEIELGGLWHEYRDGDYRPSLRIYKNVCLGNIGIPTNLFIWRRGLYTYYISGPYTGQVKGLYMEKPEEILWGDLTKEEFIRKIKENEERRKSKFKKV